MELPTYIPLDEAVRRYRIDREALTQMVESGKIRAVRIDGRIAMDEKSLEAVEQREILWRQVAHLDQVPITLYQARVKYHVGSVTLYNWIKDGIVRVLQQTYKGRKRVTLVNEADIAYAAKVAQVRNVRRGRRTFTPEYLPPHNLS